MTQIKDLLIPIDKYRRIKYYFSTLRLLSFVFIYIMMDSFKKKIKWLIMNINITKIGFV